MAENQQDFLEEQPKFVRPTLITGIGSRGVLAAREGIARIIRMFPALECAIKLIEDSSDTSFIISSLGNILSAEVPAQLNQQGYIIQELKVGSQVPVGITFVISEFDKSSIEAIRRIIKVISEAGDNRIIVKIIALLGTDPTHDLLEGLDKQIEGVTVTDRFCVSQRNESSLQLTANDETEVASQAVFMSLVPAHEQILGDSLVSAEGKSAWQAFGAASMQVPYDLALERMTLHVSSDLSEQITNRNIGPGPSVKGIIEKMAIFREIEGGTLLNHLLRDLPATAERQGDGKYRVQLAAGEMKLKLADTPKSGWVEAIHRTDRAFQTYIASMWARRMTENLEELMDEMPKLMNDGIEKVLSKEVDGIIATESILNELENRISIVESEPPELKETEHEKKRLEEEISKYPNWISFGVRYAFFSMITLVLWYHLLPKFNFSFANWLLGLILPPAIIVFVAMIYVGKRRNRLQRALDKYLGAVIRKYESILLANLKTCRDQIFTALSGTIAGKKAKLNDIRQWIKEITDELRDEYKQKIEKSTNQIVYLLETVDDLDRLYNGLNIDVFPWLKGLIENGLFSLFEVLDKDKLKEKLLKYCTKEVEDHEQGMTFRDILFSKGLEPQGDKLKVKMNEMASRSSALFPRCDRLPRRSLVITPPDIIDIKDWEEKPGSFGEYGVEKLEYDLDSIIICQVVNVSTDGG